MRDGDDAPPADVRVGDRTLAATRDGGVADATERPPRPLATGDAVGRYVVLSELGSGAMGVVYGAYDPELDRKVALKLLHARPGDTQGRAKLLLEAQALAKLAHPNVVGVYDVGAVDDRVWIAMEFVAGQTMRAWFSEAKPPWRDVLAAMIDAGRGLHAAHEQGLVHRDFKPDNVMLGDDGRARVMDFGIAFVQGAGGTAEASPGMVGTPLYMALECFAGTSSDARSDQFAFCVTLWEGLFGERPFAGASVPELAAAVLAGRVREPPRAAGVPSWLRRIVERGLAQEPDARWPSMDALVHALGRGLASAGMRRRSLAVGAAVVGVIAVFGLREVAARSRVAACEQGGQAIADSLWNDDTRGEIRDAMLSVGVDYAAGTAERVLPRLDDYAAGIGAAHAEACLRHDVRESWSADDLDRASWCLEERGLEFAALVGELSRADPPMLERAIVAVTRLPAVDRCLETEVLRRLPHPPFDRREETRSIRAEISRADALRGAGRYPAGLAVATEALRRAELLDWPPVVALARATEAELVGDNGDYAAAEQVGAQAYFEASLVGAWDVAASAAIALTFVSGVKLRHHDAALQWARHAEVALVHAGPSDSVRESHRLRNLATVHRAMNEHATARALLEQAIAQDERNLGPDHPQVARGLHNLANVLVDSGDYAAAKSLYERALPVIERAFGPTHPDVATCLSGLGSVTLLLGDRDAARGLHARALEIREAVLGRDHPETVMSLNNLGGVLEDLGESEEAHAMYQRAIAATERTGGANDPMLAMLLTNDASTRAARRDRGQVIAALERALAIYRATLGEDHPRNASALLLLAQQYDERGDREPARQLRERALRVREAALGPDHPEVASALQALAESLLAQRQAAAAVPLAERAVAIFDRVEGVQFGEPDARVVLARALSSTGGDAARIRDLEEAALRAYRAGAPDELANAARLEASVGSAPTRSAPE